MQKFYRNLKTESTYKLVYTTDTVNALPSTQDVIVVLECVEKYQKISDQTIVTIPKKLLTQYFSVEDVRRVED